MKQPQDLTGVTLDDLKAAMLVTPAPNGAAAPGASQAGQGAAPSPAPSQAAAPPPTGTQATAQAGQKKPSISVDRDLLTMRVKALAALVAANQTDPRLFVSNGALIGLSRDDHGTLATRDLRRAHVLNALLDAADWDDTPPRDLPDLLLALGEWPGLRTLTGIATAPVVAPDGTIRTGPGYDPVTRLYLDTGGLQLGDTTPTPGNVAEAKRLILDEVLSDFPFEADADRANAVALLLLPFVRPLIDDPTPLHLADAPTAGTGKGLLISVLTLPFLGREPVSRPLDADESEVRKSILSILLGGDPVAVFDNVTRIDSASLSMALTQKTVGDRQLGSSTSRTASVGCIWAATGNNVSPSAEVARRVCYIRLIANVEDPSKRAGFRHDNLKAWVRAHRGDLVTAALTLIRAWLDAGRPAGQQRKGSYDRWAATIGGILDVAGIPGFLVNDCVLQGAVESGVAAMRVFVQAWYEAHQHAPVLVDALEPLALPEEFQPPLVVAPWLGILADELTGRDRAGMRKSLGHRLTATRDKVFAVTTAGQGVIPVKLTRSSVRTRNGYTWSLAKL